MITLGKDEGGYVGTLLGGGLALAIGSTGVAIAGILTLLAGALLVTGASAGAMLRSSGRAVHRAARRTIPPRRPEPRLQVLEGAVAVAHSRRCSARAAGGRRERVSRAGLRGPRPPFLQEDEPDQESLFDVTVEPQAEYRLPDRALLRRSAPGRRPRRRPRRPRGRGARPDARQLRRRRDRDRPDRRAARDALRAAARARDEGLEGRGPEGRPLLRARDDGDPHPRADPGQAGRRRRAAEHEPEPRHARRHLRRPAGHLEPALGLARQGHLRPVRLDRPRAHAAHPDRRHDRLGQVGLHQHDPHLGAAALDARRRADDPDRPEADRAELLRVDPAPADAGRLEPEGGRDRAAQRRRRDGAPLRAPLGGARAQPRRGEPRLPLPRRADAARTCSS